MRWKQYEIWLGLEAANFSRRIQIFYAWFSITRPQIYGTIVGFDWVFMLGERETVGTYVQTMCESLVESYASSLLCLRLKCVFDSLPRKPILHTHSKSTDKSRNSSWIADVYSSSFRVFLAYYSSYYRSCTIKITFLSNRCKLVESLENPLQSSLS